MPAARRRPRRRARPRPVRPRRSQAAPALGHAVQDVHAARRRRRARTTTRTSCETVDFLAGSDAGGSRREQRLAAMRTACTPATRCRAAKPATAVQTELRRVMVRTERLAATPDRDGMIVAKELPGVERGPRGRARTTSPTRRSAGAQERRTCWSTGAARPTSSSSWTATRSKKELEAAAEGATSRWPTLSRLAGTRLTWDELRRYQPLDPGNAKMRGLATDVLDRGRLAARLDPAVAPLLRARPGPTPTRADRLHQAARLLVLDRGPEGDRFGAELRGGAPPARGEAERRPRRTTLPAPHPS